MDSSFVSSPKALTALTVKTAVSSPAGVPLISPVVSFRLSPLGSVPLAMLHVMGAVPFAVRVWLYASPSVPPGRVSVVTVGGLSGTVSFTLIAAVTAGSGCWKMPPSSSPSTSVPVMVCQSEDSAS